MILLILVPQYAQRAVMKSSRFIKLSAMAHNDADRVMEQNHNPNRRHVLVRDQSPQFTQEFLRSFKQPVDIDAISKTPCVAFRSKLSRNADPRTGCFVRRSAQDG
jgi:proteasome activator subunit 4